MEWTMMPPGAGIWYLRAGTLEALAKHSLIFGTFGPPSSELKAHLMGDESQMALTLARIALSNRTNEEGWEYVERQESMLIEAKTWEGARFRWIKHPILGTHPIQEASRPGVFITPGESLDADATRELARVARERQLAWLYLHEEHEPIIDGWLRARRMRALVAECKKLRDDLVRDLDQEKFRACPARVVRGDPHVWGYFETSIDQERCRYCDVAKQEGRHQ